MKKGIFNFVLLLTIFFSYVTNAFAGAFFNITTKGNVLTITTTIPDHTYPNAGIKITASGYSLTNPGIECTQLSNGYCVFSVSDTAPANITLNGVRGTVTATLCLNGIGPVSCQNYTISSFHPQARYAFVTNSGTNTISTCNILDSGLFDTCTDSGAGAIFDRPEQITLNAAGTIAYITNHLDNTLMTCNVSSTGTLSSCAIASSLGITPSLPVGISINSGGHIAYISDFNGVARCAINNAGEPVLCVGSGNTGIDFDHAWGLALNTAGTFAYVANKNGDFLSVCPINGLLGAFGDCVDSGNIFVGPRGVILNKANTIAYITNGSGNFVSLCPILSTGSFGMCTDAGVGAIFDEPEKLAINIPGTLTYVPNLNGNTVSICSVSLQTGLFTSCVDSGNTFNGPSSVFLVY